MPQPRFGAGCLSVPDTWGMAATLEYTEPRRVGLAVPLAGKSDTRLPGANIMIVREPALHQTARGELDNFVSGYASSTQAFSRLGDGDATFVDGSVGVFASFAFSIGNYRAAQCHLFRVDDGIATHITVSVDENSKKRLEKELLDVALGFQVAC
ncbi:MAG: hypothetical protein A2289_18305 [Deltaproteobacteria bacterium RIFOXYA12_FULL_58_15]|nr:MAG: hypothetical protein A2289_18305 [Deltaproteobacteria bacterium RIFOXYA12_FULL_58_15]OGR09680.1 MAG: hypothetical protein A2341_15035 [Deltaproteobacteria bacterium RIFOXYB12_FULL_58_9]